MAGLCGKGARRNHSTNVVWGERYSTRINTAFTSFLEDLEMDLIEDHHITHIYNEAITIKTLLT